MLRNVILVILLLWLLLWFSGSAHPARLPCAALCSHNPELEPRKAMGYRPSQRNSIQTTLLSRFDIIRKRLNADAGRLKIKAIQRSDTAE
ncbi:MAG: hypothetical protein KGZ83_10165 [Sulfuricella sp.]|nr:hypothetical protein [Sulfuricella sp.]